MIRLALAAILYAVGVAGLSFVAIQEREVPGTSGNYWPLFVLGMVLVVLAWLLLPMPPDNSGRPNGGDRDEGSV